MVVSDTDSEYDPSDNLPESVEYDQNDPSNLKSFAKLLLLLPVYIMVITVASIGKITMEFVNWVLDYER